MQVNVDTLILLIADRIEHGEKSLNQVATEHNMAPATVSRYFRAAKNSFGVRFSVKRVENRKVVQVLEDAGVFKLDKLLERAEEIRKPEGTGEGTE